MYSNKDNINILTATLAKSGVAHAVVCPGSRNAPIVHNLNECPSIICHAVTDERSAGFYALGISLATGLSPVVVCVTSGSALLNLAPAVAEAHYQHVPLVVVSADRPEQWIGQLDGQTLPQPGAFGVMVRRCVQLPEPAGEEQAWHCRRIAREALHAATWRTPGPVHINVPISEPLFTFNKTTLPDILPLNTIMPFQPTPSYHILSEAIAKSSKPMVVIGQTYPGTIGSSTLKRLSQHAAVWCEALSARAVHFDEVIAANGNAEELTPDYIIYVGDTIVSKRGRQFLRASGANTALVTCDGSTVPDPTTHLTDIIECQDSSHIKLVIEAITDVFDNAHMADTDDNGICTAMDRKRFACTWNSALEQAECHAANFIPPYSQMAAVAYLEQQLDDMDYSWQVHYANSTAIRLANIFADHHVWCNRGVNGIEGSLSTAAGFSLATDDTVFCVIGDLSFLYDQNALWNASLKGNLRIVLLNNGGGGIFECVKGLPESSAPMHLVAGTHHTGARGICTQNDIGYIAAHNSVEMKRGIVELLTIDTGRPVVLEVFTDSGTDAKALKDYISRL